jgi:mannose-1-phosphate guanylyltransferase
MNEEANTWALVLAGGDGTRLRSLTTRPGARPVPKQFCSLHDGPSLLQEALFRARAVTSDRYTTAVVAAHHRHWWEPMLWSLPPANIVVQPENRGTANGILLPLLHIVERDPSARIVILPADHHVREESVLALSLRHAVEQLQWRFDETLLLGLKPEECDPDLGYILPGPTDGRRALEVKQFVEKPSMALAGELIEQGGLWNSFIVISTAQALLSLFRRRLPEVVKDMRAAVQSDLYDSSGGLATAALYERLPAVDFSREILQGNESRLRVLPVPRCGWSDLGTPQRVADALRHVPSSVQSFSDSIATAYMSLAAQHARLQAASL